MLDQIGTLGSDIDAIAARRSDEFQAILKKFDFTFKPGLCSLFCRSRVPTVNKALASELMMKLPETERDEALRVIGLIDQKSDLAKVVLEESRIKALLKLWLFIHVPVSIGLCVALAIHILSVFFFW